VKAARVEQESSEIAVSDDPPERVGVAPGGRRAGRSAVAIAIAIVVGIAVAVALLYVFVRDPLLRELGQLSGSSRTVAVLLGWSLWGVPLALTIAFGWCAGRLSGRPRLVVVGLLLLLVCTWLPAVALLPGRGAMAQHALISAAVAQAPAVASSLLAGLYAGGAAALVGLVAVTRAMRRRKTAGSSAHNRAVWSGVMVTAALLGLAAALAFGRVSPPGLAFDKVWPPGKSWTINGKLVRVLGVARSNGCKNLVLPEAAGRLLEDYGCGGSERGLFTDSHDDALVAVTVVAMPTAALAGEAVERLQRAQAVPAPLRALQAAATDTARAGVLVQSFQNQLLLLHGARNAGTPTQRDGAQVASLLSAVDLTILYG
jgi:hypothetical protein